VFALPFPHLLKILFAVFAFTLPLLLAILFAIFAFAFPFLLAILFVAFAVVFSLTWPTPAILIPILRAALGAWFDLF